MKHFAVFFLFAVASARHLSFDENLDEEWEFFKKTFGKKYQSSEEASRRSIWQQSVVQIALHNLKADLGLESYRAGLNEYSDLDHSEFVRILNGYQRKTAPRNGSEWLPTNNVRIPGGIDWRDQGLVTPVKNQGLCGSCWAFSATGSLEGQHKKKSGQLVSLSEQNLMDCSVPEGNKGCDGGWMDQAFDYIKKNGGIDTESSYPYQDWQQPKCYFKQSEVGATCTGYVDIPSGDEEALKEAVATVGPVSVAIDASRPSFQYYKNGIYNEWACGNTEDQLDHGVLVVGYGSNMNTDYWLVKNSWGESWGNKGYIQMSRNKNNQCGIATKASYPLV